MKQDVMMPSSNNDNPFHRGEQSVQARYGLKERMAQTGAKAIRDHLPEQHRGFYPLLPFILLGTTDRDGWPWASMLTGPLGFVQSPDPYHLRIQAKPMPGDPLQATLSPGVDVGLLGIELPTRRRNRLHGHVVALDEQGILIRVKQSFGNCPKYIQARDVRFLEAYDPQPDHIDQFTSFTAKTRALLCETDTFFIASAYQDAAAGAAAGVDVSHRGGKPGFVNVVDDGHFMIPDFAGNRFFNTLGNLLLNPRAGFLFTHFGTGDVVYLTGTVDIVWDGPEVAAFSGAERVLKVQLHRGIHSQGGLPLMAQFISYAPSLAPTGTWSD